MKLTKHFVIIILAAINVLTAGAVTRFYTADQLSSNLITSLCQDRQGYIWIGTEYGLNKFDGVYFTQYYNDDTNPGSLADDIVRQLTTDGEGRLWVVTNRSVQRYCRRTDSFEAVSFGGSPTANINDILYTPEGRIWLLSANDGIYEVDTEKMTAQPLADINRSIRKKEEGDNMYLDSKGRLWLGFRKSGLQMIDTRTGRTTFYEGRQLNDGHPCDIVEDNRHRLTIATYTDLLQLDERTMNFEVVVSYTRSSVYRVFPGGKHLYVGMSGNGLWRADLDKHQLLPVEQLAREAAGQGITKVYAYLEDRNGNQWIGCSQKGLLFVSAKDDDFHFMPLSQIQSNNGNLLRSVFADNDQHLYICQEQGGIVGIDHQGHTLSHWMDGYTVMTVFDDRHGSHWAGTFRNGLFRIDPQSGRSEWISSTGTQRIGSITSDLNGNLYTASFSDGLHSYTPDAQTERTLGGGQLRLSNPYLNTLFTDKDGRIWIGHYYGIDVYDPQTDRLADVSVDDALRPAIVYTIGQSPKDNSIWIGSNKGLFQYYTEGKEKGTWKRFTEKDGLPNNIVCNLIITTDGTIWASTYRGMCQISTDGSFTRYYRGNGLKEWSFLRGVGCTTSTGEVVFGSLGGITRFVPERITKDEFRQGITLTAMRLGDVDVNTLTLSNGHQILSEPADEAAEIQLSYLDNTFSLRFSSMDFRDAENVHYEFRLGDGQWYQTESGRSEIYFSHLAAGSHLLQVRAYDNGIYSPIKEIRLSVSPPWYRTWVAYLFYLLAVVGIAALWWRNFWNRRYAEVNEEKIKFFVDISHELRSPLTLIKSPLEQLLRTSHDAQTTRALRNMERNTNRMLTLLNQILSIRKIEKGQMALHFAETPFGDFVSDICHDFDYQTERRQLTLTCHNEAADMTVWIDRDNFDKVVGNLVGNAIKYVGDGGHIDVTISQPDGQTAELTVSDDGPGIDETQLKKVFDRFYQSSARPAAGQMSYGIGLNLTQKIVQLHGGTIEARNRTDAVGSVFIVRLPLGNAHLPKHQLTTGDYYAPQPSQPEDGRPAFLTDTERHHAVRRRTSYRVVVVDDDDELRTFLQTELGETYHVATYADGQSALEGIVAAPPDLVVSDVVMPRMDGFELLKRLKRNTKTSHVPVVMLTTKTDHQARLEALGQGADAYVDKPFNMEELEARIASLIANRIRMRGKFSGVQEQEDTVRKVELKGNDAALMEKIMKAVNSRLDDSDFNVEALADEVGLSRVQLHRRMKELTGITVGEFIRNLRLQQAAKLLERGDTTISQVTYAVGFANPTHFAASFKKHFGVTPSEYMAKHQHHNTP